jgi:hypothetical protein
MWIQGSDGGNYEERLFRMWCLFDGHIAILFHSVDGDSVMLCNVEMFLQYYVASHARRLQLSVCVAEGTVPVVKYRS